MFAQIDHQGNPLKSAFSVPLTKFWFRMAIFAMSVGFLNIALSQFSWVYAQGSQYTQSAGKNKQKPMVGQKGSSAKKASSRQSRKDTASSARKTKPSQVASRRQPIRAKTARSERHDRSVQSVRPIRASFGQMAGLHATADALGLHSSVALVVDQNTNEVLFSKNDNAVLPIASLTKLMTGLVIAEANLPMDEKIQITQADVDTEKGSSSRLAVGTVLSRGDLMHLALMSSENRAAHALGRTFPGGMGVFVNRMNQRAVALGMSDTRYVEPTGLSSLNQSSASDLAVLTAKAYNQPMLRELSTSHGREVSVGRRTLQYNNTNRLVKNPDWDIGLQKTGYISEAGRCLVMQAQVAGRSLIMVFLDSAGKFSRLGDAERVRKWLEQTASRHSGAAKLADDFPG